MQDTAGANEALKQNKLGEISHDFTGRVVNQIYSCQYFNELHMDILLVF
jgi:hypothetical protein